MLGSNPSIGEDSFMSRATPWGSPSTMSTSTTSARPFWTTRMAVVAPTNPLPTMVTRMSASLPLLGGQGLRQSGIQVARRVAELAPGLGVGCVERGPHVLQHLPHVRGEAGQSADHRAEGHPELQRAIRDRDAR